MLLNKVLMDKISVLTELVNVAVIDENVFVYDYFEPSISNNTSSIDFNTLKCMCITSFIQDINIDPSLNPNIYLSKFGAYLERCQSMIVKFNKTTNYFLFCR